MTRFDQNCLKVLFISSGNSEIFEIVPFIKRQADSLVEVGVTVDFFLVKGKGIRGYLKNIKKLRKKLKTEKYDLIHAHYTFNGLLFLLTGRRIPLVVSYMGSDTYGDYDERGRRIPKSYVNVLIAKIIQPFLSQIIVKSPNLFDYIYREAIGNLIPNGINMEFFKPGDQEEARKAIGLSTDKKVVLFLGDPKNKRKNYALAKESVDSLGNEVELLSPFPVTPESINKYYNAADVFILTSFDEGSPNAVKEAMACNLPIVSTAVGDVEWLLKDVEGAYIGGFSAEDFSEQLKKAVEHSSTQVYSSGRQKLIDLRLASHQVADNILKVYEKALKN